MAGLKLFEEFLSRFTSTGASADVTRYTLTLEDPDATTGWYAKGYGTGATIQMPIISKAAQSFLTGMGLYVRRDALGLTLTAVQEGDKITDKNSNTYIVQTVKPHYFGDTLVFYEVDLTYLGSFL